MMNDYRVLVANEWVGTDGNDSFVISDPATAEVVSRLPGLGADAVDAAVIAGERALWHTSRAVLDEWAVKTGSTNSLRPSTSISILQPDVRSCVSGQRRATG